MSFRWGIIGLGKIARAFANGLKDTPGGELYAVGSRSLEKAKTFGEEFGAVRCYGSYSDLVEDPNIDAVYIATPHTSHYSDTLLALNSGKAALTEKPFTLNAKEAALLFDQSHLLNVFLMEAMWTRFTPIMAAIRELASGEAIGEVRFVQADFGFRADFDPAGRLFSAELGGGALLDVGVYAISFASMLLGAPEEVAGFAHLGETGVDEQSAYLLKFRRGEIAVLSSAIRTNTAQTATIYGTKGRISIPSPWWIPQRISVVRDGKEPENIAIEFVGNGYNYEALEVQRCVNAGKIESEILPHDETIAIMKTMDTLRAQWGLVYPHEKQ